MIPLAAKAKEVVNIPIIAGGRMQDYDLALEAVEKYGAWKGGWLALKRILRCHPFYRGEHGYYDPVP